MKKDTKWYLSVRHIFTFDGKKEHKDSVGNNIVYYEKDSSNGARAFEYWDTEGRSAATIHPNILFSLLKTKGSVNLHIKMLAEDLSKERINKLELRAFCIKIKAPCWFRKAVENQRDIINSGLDIKGEWLTSYMGGRLAGVKNDKYKTEEYKLKGRTMEYFVDGKKHEIKEPTIIRVSMGPGGMNYWWAKEQTKLYKL